MNARENKERNCGTTSLCRKYSIAYQVFHVLVEQILRSGQTKRLKWDLHLLGPLTSPQPGCCSKTKKQPLCFMQITRQFFYCRNSLSYHCQFTQFTQLPSCCCASGKIDEREGVFTFPFLLLCQLLYLMKTTCQPNKVPGLRIHSNLTTMSLFIISKRAEKQNMPEFQPAPTLVKLLREGVTSLLE